MLLGSSCSIVCLLLSCSMLHNVSAALRRRVESDELRLIQDVLANARDSQLRLVRPVKKVNDTININLGLSLVQLLDFDETKQIITLSVRKHLKWVDELTSWNASDYEGVDKMSLPSDALWTPDIMLYDNVEQRDIEEHKEKLILRHNGEVEWLPYVVYKSACQVDMANFPFDTQTCSLKFGSWSYAAKELDLVFFNGEANFRLAQTMNSMEWNIISTSAERNVEFDNCCPEKYVRLTFSMEMTRQRGFFSKFILLPTLLLSCVSLVIFWIPPMRPDRTGLGTSLLGCFMLLLILVTQISPPSQVMKFVTYICCNMFMVSAAILYSVAMVNLSNRATPLPSCTKRCCLDILGRVFLCSPRPSKKDANGAGPSGGSSHLLEGEKDSGKVKTPAHQQDWHDVVQVLDRIMFVLFTIYMIICVSIFFPRP